MKGRKYEWPDEGGCPGKKSIRKTIALGLAGLLYATIVSATDYKVREQMPGYLHNQVVGIQEWSGNGKNGAYLHTHDSNGKCKHTAIFLYCEGVKQKYPYAIYVYEEDRLYVDNDPTDGLVDKIVDVPRHKMSRDAPDCE